MIYVDDSGSMSFEENGERIKDLQLILQRAAFAATLFDDDGVEIRFMNEDLPPQQVSNIRSEQQIEQILASKRYKGLTPFGTELRKKVVDPILVSKLNSGQMRKPLLIISITDGQPAGENQNTLVETVQYACQAAQRSPYGAGAVAFQFAQVGNDQKATEFLAKLDNDPMVGREVDCTSSECSPTCSVFARRTAISLPCRVCQQKTTTTVGPTLQRGRTELSRCSTWRAKMLYGYFVLGCC